MRDHIFLIKLDDICQNGEVRRKRISMRFSSFMNIQKPGKIQLMKSVSESCF